MGFTSAFFIPSSSVLTDFGGIITRLPPHRFDVSLIYVADRTGPTPPFLQNAKDAGVGVLEIKKVPGWLPDARQRIAALELDLLVHLDLTMSHMSTRIAMSLLAPVQVCAAVRPCRLPSARAACQLATLPDSRPGPTPLHPNDVLDAPPQPPKRMPPLAPS